MLNPFLTIKKLKKLIDNKELTTQEIITFYSKRLQKYDKTLGATLSLFEKKSINENINKNGILAGIPGLLKANISQKNRLLNCGSKILENYRAPYDATVTKRLKEAGAPILGVANMDEFAMGASGEFSAYKITRNPWDLSRVPGGSSSGPAAAVAAGLVPWAIGTETGGSVRQPASFTGLVGLYPTYGTFSRYGIIAFTSSTDQPGPLTKTVYDNALISSVLIGQDPNDSTSTYRNKVNFTKNLTGKLPKDLTIGVIKDAIDSEGVNIEVKKSFENAIKQLEKLGAKIKYIDLPDLKYGISVYFIISRAEAASNLARFDGSLYGMRNMDAEELKEMYVKTRHDGFGIEVKRRLLMGNYVLSTGHKDSLYKKADHLRAMIRAEFEQAFKSVDLLISPTASTLPFKLESTSKDPLKMYLSDYFTVPNCITGNPALSLPSGFSKEGLPIGFQFIGPRLSEELIYQVAYAFEQSTDFHTKTPKGFE